MKDRKTQNRNACIYCHGKGYHGDEFTGGESYCSCARGKALMQDEQLCPGGCNNTGWQSGDDEGFICDVCDRACVCVNGVPNSNCLVHQ